MIAALLVGVVAGWLAGRLVRGAGYGLIGDLLLGLVGGAIGRWLFRAVGVAPSATTHGMIGALATATLGAVALVLLSRLVRSTT